MQKNTGLLIIFSLLFTHFSFSQKTDSTKSIYQIKGAVTVTTKGISLVPTFTLGKPAAIFDLSMGKKKLFFEPQLRFSLKGKPWSFLFWWRYKLVKTNKIAVTLGAHPALNFREETNTVNGVSNTIIVVRRYLAAEISPNYFISKNTSIGMYYLISHGLDKGTINTGHFLTINSNFSHIKLGEQFFARFNPQVYYLNQDGKDGFYCTAALTLAKKNFPLTLQSIMNKVIHTNITSQNFVWNVSLVYSFNKKYVKI